jgi:hypothetical protein
MSNNPNQTGTGTMGGNTTQAPTGQNTQNNTGSLTQNPQINKIQTCDNPAVDRIPEPLDDNNWSIWKERITPVFCLCGVEGYIEGTIPHPTDTTQAKNWDFNDDYAKVLIQNYISASQIIYTSQCNTASTKWASLVLTHAPHGHQTAMAVMRNLFRAAAGDEMNINDHINNLKMTWQRLNSSSGKHVHLSNLVFKSIIAQSLLDSWDTFTRPYIKRDTEEMDLAKAMSSHEFIGLIREEYTHCVDHARGNESVNQVRTDRPSLADRLTLCGLKKLLNAEKCKQCGYKNHTTQECIFLGQSKCTTCNRFRHSPQDCWFKDRPPKQKGGGQRNRPDKKARNESVNEAKENNKKGTADAPKKSVAFNVVEDNMQDSARFEEVDKEAEIAVEWDEDEIVTLNDLSIATTSHIANNRGIFKTYEATSNASVMGVGGPCTDIKGRGTVELESKYMGQTYVLQLVDVLHIPSNRNNLILLGRWDSAGGTYRSDNGILKLTINSGTVIAKGRKVHNHIYKMMVRIINGKLNNKQITRPQTRNLQVFLSEGSPETWET